jgi:hypothetical protein
MKIIPKAQLKRLMMKLFFLDDETQNLKEKKKKNVASNFNNI